MSVQQKLSSFKTKLSEEECVKIGIVLDLEQKYFDLLWELFNSQEFISELRSIESEIQNNYDFIQNHYDDKNKLKIPAERLVRQFVYKNLSNKVLHIYPSPVSSDIAFVTDDAVIQLDVKTMDTVSNRGDIRSLEFLPNQSSFENINLDRDVSGTLLNSGTRVECSLPKEYSFQGESPLPVLTYFVTFVYNDNNRSFSLACNDRNFDTIYLKCLPNGFESILFDFDIVDNIKQYSYLTGKNDFQAYFLTNNAEEREEKINEFIDTHKEDHLVRIRGRTKSGIYEIFRLHPRYNVTGVSWFPVKRKNRTSPTGRSYYLEAVDHGMAARISNRTLLDRYNSKDEHWEGVKSTKIS